MPQRQNTDIDKHTKAQMTNTATVAETHTDIQPGMHAERHETRHATRHEA